MKQGKKFDIGKPQYSLLPWDAVEEVVRVLDFGAKKYGPRNWEKGMKWSRLFDSVTRHITNWFMGEDNDPESGLHHLAHAACCCLFMLAWALRKMDKFDDRPKRRKYEPER